MVGKSPDGARRARTSQERLCSGLNAATGSVTSMEFTFLSVLRFSNARVLRTRDTVVVTA